MIVSDASYATTKRQVNCYEFYFYRNSAQFIRLSILIILLGGGIADLSKDMVRTSRKSQLIFFFSSWNFLIIPPKFHTIIIGGSSLHFD